MPSRFAPMLALAAYATLLAANSAPAQQLEMPSDPLAGTVIETDGPSPSATTPSMSSANVVPSGGDISMSGGSPSSMYSSGAYYNPTLGAHLRATYTTQSYGQEDGQLSLGTMKLFGADGGMSFIDGQVTMNDASNVGYNLGIGYRWMTLPLFPFSPDSQKIGGVSLWSDGLSKGDGTFFPQVGVSLELLGDHLDFRANGYMPVGERTQTRDFFQTGQLTYSGNSLATQLQGVADTALNIGEVELAGRIANYDAWVFGGGYGFSGGEFEGGGGKVGLRGYATPDLMVSVAIANDSEFDTNTLVNLTWFIGRTRAENCPRGELSDRFREPVLRNNYVALQQSTVFEAGGPLLDEDGQAFRIVHVDSSAAPGGDGSFENPLDSIGDILTNSQTGDIVLAHGGSVFSGQSAVLQNEQLFVGEGGNNPFTVTQFGGRMFTLPETAPGALAGPVPQINNPTTAGVVLADDNTVRNFSFNGGVNAITSDTVNGSNNATLQDLTIANTTGNAINLVSVTAADVDDLDDDDDTSETVSLLGAVAISDVTFSGSGGSDIFIDGEAASADNIRAQQIAISNIESSGAANASVDIRNTTNVTGSSTSITNYDYDGGATGGGGLLLTNTGSSTVVTESDFTGGTGPAIRADGTIGNVVFGSTNSISNITGNAVEIEGNTGTVNVSSGIETDATVNGGTVQIVANEGSVTIGGSIEANEALSLDILNAKSSINVGGVNTGPGGGNTLITNTGAVDAIRIVDDGTDSDTSSEIAVTINGDVTNEGGRSLFVDNINDTVQFAGDITDDGAGIRIEDLASGAQVNFGPQVTLNTGANATAAVSLNNNDADSIVDFIGLDITTTTGDAIVSNGGELNVSGAGNTISVADGQAINITSTFSQSSGGAGASDGLNFTEIDATDGSGAAPISIVDYDGRVVLGSAGAANDSTLSSTGTAIVLTDVTNATITNLTIDSSTGTAIDIDSDNSTASSVTLTDVTTNNGVATAVNATQGATAGNLSLTINDSTMNQTTTDGLVLDGVDGTVAVNDTTFNDGAGNGIRIVGGDGTFTFDEEVEITGKTGTSFGVNGGAGSITYDGSITNSVGNSVRIENRTGGSVTFGPDSTINDTGEGIVVTGNTGGNHSFLGETNVTSTTNDAVTVTNNTAGSTTFADLDVETTTGRGIVVDGNTASTTFTSVDVTTTTGNAVEVTNNNAGSTTSFSGLTIATGSGAAFTASGGGTVGVSGTTNTITTETGDGIEINGMTIAAGGVNFDEVNVGTTGPAASAVFLQDNTGGIVSIGSAASTTDGDGGEFNTTGTAVTVTNSSGLTMRNVDITASGDPSIDINSTNGTDMNVLLVNVDTPDNVTIDHTGDGDVVFTYNSSTVNGDIIANHSGDGTFDFNSSNLDVNGMVDVNATDGGEFDFFASNLDINTGGDVVGLAIDIGGSVPDADISLTGSSTSITTGNASAMVLNATDADVRFALSSAELTNNSADQTFLLQAQGTAGIEATLTSNSIDNNGAGDSLLIDNFSSASTDLSFSNNSGSSGDGLVLRNRSASINRFQIMSDDPATLDDDNNNDVTFRDPANAVPADPTTVFDFDPDLSVTAPSN